MLDDRQAYVLNTLLERGFDIGRVLRFRRVQRGRQAPSFELLTAQGGEYLLSIFPPQFPAPALDDAARVCHALFEKKLPVPPPLPARAGGYVAPGPQHSHLALSAAPEGQAMAAEQWSLQDLSLLGLRLAWLHRALAEVGPPPEQDYSRPADDALLSLSLEPWPPMAQQVLAQAAEAPLSTRRWLHGDVHAQAILLDADRHVSAFIDNGLMHAGDQQQDVLDVFVNWCLDETHFVRDEHARAFFSAYRTLAPENVGDFSLAVVRWAAWRIRTSAHNIQPPPHGFPQLLANLPGLATAANLCAGN